MPVDFMDSDFFKQHQKFENIERGGSTPDPQRGIALGGQSLYAGPLIYDPSIDTDPDSFALIAPPPRDSDRATTRAGTQARETACTGDRTATARIRAYRCTVGLGSC